MKRNSKFIMLGVIALTGVTAFTSCSSDESAPVNPTFDGESVKTQFSISLPGNGAKTRMTTATVQEGAQTDLTKFRGMQDIVLIPYAHATDRASRLGNRITLAANTMVVPEGANNAAYEIPNGKLLSTNNNAVLYKDVTIPVGTSAFLFYGKAKGTDGYEEGYLTANNLTDDTKQASDISFSPKPIQTEFNSAKGTALATYVTNIAGAKAGDDANDAAWWKCTDATNYGTQTWFSAALGDLYRSFISLKPGASSYVQAAVQDLYTTLLPNTDAVSTAIKAAIKDDTNAKDTDADGKLEFQDVINNYPGEDYNSMPDGCAALTWSNVPAENAAATQAATATAVNESNFGGGLTNVQAMAKVVYPASLYYFVDSPVKASITSRQADYVTSKSWTDILATYTNGTSVASTTRSVAITKPIQYAVGRLDLKVNKLSEATYYDRRGEAVTIPTAGFQITGVLIGGQKQVDYKFNQVSSSTDEYAIYDKTINTGATNVKTDADAATNYTLALETAEDQVVYVAVEFLNNSGKDFMGVDGVVKDNCKFYMIAKLDPKGTEASKPSEMTEYKVFAQDYKTIANFTFGVGSQDLNTTGDDGIPNGIADTPGGFANAYVTIPDLRTPKLELGFSVDLTWKTGITFNHTF